jgi:hypothetical protein
MTEEFNTTFVVHFRPTVVGLDAIRAVRAVLKFALRRFGLKCVEAREISDAAAPAILTDGKNKPDD